MTVVYVCACFSFLLSFFPCFNPLTSRDFCQKCSFQDVLEIFGLDMDQINSNVLKKAFATSQHAFLLTSIAFYDIFAGVCMEIKIFYPFCLFVFFFLSFFSFCYFVIFVAVIDLLLSLLPVEKLRAGSIKTGNFCHGVATFSGTKFCSEFFTLIFQALALCQSELRNCGLCVVRKMELHVCMQLVM